MYANDHGKACYFTVPPGVTLTAVMEAALETAAWPWVVNITACAVVLVLYCLRLKAHFFESNSDPQKRADYVRDMKLELSNMGRAAAA